MDQNVLDSMQKIVATAFAEKLFTDVEILLAAKNKILFHQAYSSSSTTSQKNSIFDLASLTKPLATSLAVMKLIEENKLSLKTPVADFFTNKTREKSSLKVLSADFGNNLTEQNKIQTRIKHNRTYFIF